MTEIKIGNASVPALNWLAARIEGVSLTQASMKYLIERYGDNCICTDMGSPYSPATEWQQAGALIQKMCAERTFKLFASKSSDCHATLFVGTKALTATGPTPLVAALRVYLKWRLGEHAAVPDEIAYEAKTAVI